MSKREAWFIRWTLCWLGLALGAAFDWTLTGGFGALVLLVGLEYFE